MILDHKDQTISKKKNTMINESFEYNKKGAFCNFCSRKKNPHPDFDEPLVVRGLKLNNKNLSICINCHHEMLEQSNGDKNIFDKILSNKYNLIYLLRKTGVL
tara:strand:- start:491 stop:796 length:306 start_codon:yes stop_codon:yes gene_type:complete